MTNELAASSYHVVKLIGLITMLRCAVVVQADCTYGCLNRPPEFPDINVLFRRTIARLRDDVDLRGQLNSSCCASEVNITELNMLTAWDHSVNLDDLCSTPTVSTRSTTLAVSTSSQESVTATGLDSSLVTQNASVPVLPVTRPVIVPTQRPEIPSAVVMIVALVVAAAVLIVIIILIVVIVLYKRRKRREDSALVHQTSNGHVSQDSAHKNNRARSAPANRQPSNASTAPLCRADSTASSNSGSTDLVAKYPRQDSLGPIDEIEVEMPASPLKIPQRQDSNSSSTWLIRPPDSSSPSDYILQLPAIDEITGDDDIPRTLPRHGMKPDRRPHQPVPANSDPPRRRRLPYSVESQQPGSPASHAQQLNDGYVHDEDDHDDDDKLRKNTEENVDEIHQNTADMFNMALQQAVMIEQEGIDSSIDRLPEKADNLHDSWSAPGSSVPHWRPTELPSVASHA